MKIESLSTCTGTFSNCFEKDMWLLHISSVSYVHYWLIDIQISFRFNQFGDKKKCNDIFLGISLHPTIRTMERLRHSEQQKHACKYDNVCANIDFSRFSAFFFQFHNGACLFGRRYDTYGKHSFWIRKIIIINIILMQTFISNFINRKCLNGNIFAFSLFVNINNRTTDRKTHIFMYLT